MLLQLTKYSIIGSLCAVADLAVLYLLVEYLHVWYLFSAAISFSVVSLFGYWGQKKFTFKDGSRNHAKQLPVFFLVAGTGLLINSVCMFLFVSVLGVWYIFANVVTKFLVLVWNFFANRHITFKPAISNEG